MSESPITVDPGASRRTAFLVSHTYTELMDLLQEVRTHIAALQSGGSSGTAGEALQSRFPSIMENFNALTTDLEAVGKDLGLTGNANVQEQIDGALSDAEIGPYAGI